MHSETDKSVYKCCVCGRILNPYCNLKEYEGKKYCVPHYLKIQNGPIQKAIEAIKNQKDDPIEPKMKAGCLKVERGFNDTKI